MKRKLTIIGGGLGGLALANGLSRAKLPVEVIEAGLYPRHRVCGEFMAGVSEKALADLGIESCFHDALQHRTTLWFSKGQPVRQYQLPRPVMGISRFALDSRMAELFRQRGGELREGTRHELEPVEGRIFSCGRAPAKGGYFGLKGHWSNIPEGVRLIGSDLHGKPADLELHLGTNAYVGLSAVESGHINVCGLFQSIAEGEYGSPLERFHATLVKHGLEYLSRRLELAEYRENSFCSVSGLSYQSPTNPTSVDLGDRHRLIPPFTGNGMSIAIESAHRLLPLAVAYAENRIDWVDFVGRQQHLLRTSFNRRYRTAGLLHPFLLRPSLQAFLCSLSRANLIPFKSLYKLTHV